MTIQLDAGSGPKTTSEALKKEISALDWRDLQLWALTALLLVVIGAGITALTLPGLLWNLGATLADQHNLPQLVVGLFTLLVLLNAYTLHQRIRLQKTRQELFDQLQQLQTISELDPLTGAFNRRLMNDILHREVSRAQRAETQLCLMVVDIDHFKLFNTKFGHVVGDRILVEVAQRLKKNFRAFDSVIRYGGDEFVVIMPDTSIPQAKIAEERLHRMLAKWNDDSRSQEYHVTLSSGIAQYESGQSSEQLIHRADQAMFSQKHGSRLAPHFNV